MDGLYWYVDKLKGGNHEGQSFPLTAMSVTVIILQGTDFPILGSVP